MAPEGSADFVSRAGRAPGQELSQNGWMGGPEKEFARAAGGSAVSEPVEV